MVSFAIKCTYQTEKSYFTAQSVLRLRVSRVSGGGALPRGGVHARVFGVVGDGGRGGGGDDGGWLGGCRRRQLCLDDDVVRLASCVAETPPTCSRRQEQALVVWTSSGSRIQSQAKPNNLNINTKDGGSSSISRLPEIDWTWDEASIDNPPIGCAIPSGDTSSGVATQVASLVSRCMIDACVDVLPLPGALEFESIRAYLPPTQMHCGPGTTISSTLPNAMHGTHLPVSLVEERDFCNPVVSGQPYISTHIIRPWQARIALHVIFLSRNSAPELGRISQKSFFMAVTITARRFMSRTVITRNHNSKLDPGALQLSYSVLPG
ncbi:hypothetical protein FDECE_15846 [Fusarium decemcellulare]|nr:hypothetical protein FDECE_15846 [Fusarium decemcellulare]